MSVRSDDPVALALLGAGIFVRDTYLPVLKDQKNDFLLRYIWSRTKEAAEASVVAVHSWRCDCDSACHSAAEAVEHPSVGGDGGREGERDGGGEGRAPCSFWRALGSVEAVWGEEGLRAIERSKAVEACAVVLPVQVQPAIVLRLLTAGKHVLSEKPLAANVQEGAAAVRAYRELQQRWQQQRDLQQQQREGEEDEEDGRRANLPVLCPVWQIAENFRFEPAFERARDLLTALSSCLLSCHVTIEVPLSPRSKYFNSAWRRDPHFTGAFITDCGVHYVAGLRLMTGREVVSVAAMASHRVADVPSPDHVAAVIRLSDGSCGTLSVSFSDVPQGYMSWRAVCRGGSVEVQRGFFDGQLGFRVTAQVPPSSSASSSLKAMAGSWFHPVAGLQTELQVFADDVRARRGGEQSPQSHDDRGTPENAIQDLAIIEAVVLSGLQAEAMEVSVSSVI